jgi:hypothetical protein
VTDNGGNGIEVSGGCFFFPTPTGTENLIQANFSKGNAGVDMADQGGGCANTWKANNFENDSEDDGPRQGCIK